MAKQPVRKVIQIATCTKPAHTPELVLALCDDSTIWMHLYGQDWEMLPAVPGTTGER